METKHLVVLVVLSMTLLAGCMEGGGSGVTEDAGPETEQGPEVDDSNDGDEDGGEGDEDGGGSETSESEGNGTDGTQETVLEVPEPYTDAVVAFVVDGETRGTLAVEVPETASEYDRGLMGRESLPENTGMLFVYGNADVKTFWMKDTLVPLDIIFVDAEGRVINVEHASPGFEGERVCSNPDYYCSDGPAKYVVETERGYANRTGLSPGDRLVVNDLR